ncbi:MAG TPA: molybdopterin dinucleotide binding domain-containing protein [Candidatus Bathyarchaeia archaeon]|nr:molybdopterin dinucleotide binding domain-containing protein [Candidatus Bathyarchaeia archaeon]
MPTEGRILYHFHTGTMTRKSPTLVAQAPEGYVEVNPDDARELGLSDG